MWLKKYLEITFEVPVVVSEKAKFGDYSTNILLMHKLNKDTVVKSLLNHDLIDSVQVINGHVNLALRSDLIEYEGRLSDKPLRLRGLHDLMANENMTEGIIEDEWIDLAKKVNELNYTIENYNETFDLEEKVIGLFKSIDHAYVYRFQSKTYIGGIYRVLHQLLIALGRINYE